MTNSEDRHRLYILLYLILIILSIAAHLVYIQADPPLDLSKYSPFSDEYLYPTGASHFVSQGKLKLDQLNLFPVCPLETGVWTVAFSLFDPSATAARGGTVVLAILSLILFTFLAAEGFGRRVAAGALLLVAFNYPLTMFGRLSFPVFGQIFLSLLTIYLWRLGRRHRVALLAAGVACFWASVTGTAGFFMLPAALAATVMFRFHAIKMPWAQQVSKRIRVFWLGALLGGAIWTVFILLPYRADIINNLSRELRYPGTLKGLLTNCFFAPHKFAQLARKMPAVVLVSALYFIFFGKDLMRRLARHHEYSETKIWFLCWLLSALVFLAAQNMILMRHLLILILPLCLIAADGLFNLAGMRRFEKPRVDFTNILGLQILIVWFLVQWIVRSLFLKHQLTVHLPAFMRAHQNTWEFLIDLSLTVLVTIVFAHIYRKWKVYSLDVSRPVVTAIAAVIFILSSAFGGYQFFRWVSHPAYDLQKAKSAFNELVPSGTVAGDWAPAFAFGTPVHGLLVQRSMNSVEPIKKYDISYLLLQPGTPEAIDRHPFLLKEDPELPRKAQLLSTYAVAGKKINLYRIAGRGPGETREGGP